jgi:Tol biopolymer transport system component
VEGNNLINPTVSSHGDRMGFEDGAFWDTHLSGIDLSGYRNKNMVTNRLISSTKEEFESRLSPDGKKIAYISNRSGSHQIYKCDVDGSNTVRLTDLDDSFIPGAPSWSPDGNMIAIDGDIKGQAEIFIINADGGTPKNITNHPAQDHSPRYSSNGQWIYFNSNRSGVWQIWKSPAEGGEAVQVTDKGGFCGLESPDGKWVFYTKFDYTSGIWKIPVQGGTETLALNCNLTSWNSWDLVKEGIYFVNKTEGSDFSIEFFEFLTGEIKTQAVIADKNILSIGEIDISPDRSWLIYIQANKNESDIYLVENFR